VSITDDRCLSNGCADLSSPCTAACAADLEPATICGTTMSLSPFGLFKAIDTTGPVFGGVPGTIVAHATSTAGAIVRYTAPTAVDDTSGARPVVCTPLSGSQFRPGRTTVTCTASDATGNTSTASFLVWVQYEAPDDGSFFLRPIRPDGSSVFQIGRAVPVKFKLTGASRNITDLEARLIVTKLSDVVQGRDDCEGDEAGEDAGFRFEYRKGPGIYAYRWKTRGESRGTYRLRADLGDEVTHVIDVSLTKAK
jgi:hypothetical protein